MFNLNSNYIEDGECTQHKITQKVPISCVASSFSKNIEFLKISFNDQVQGHNSIYGPGLFLTGLGQFNLNELIYLHKLDTKLGHYIKDLDVIVWSFGKPYGGDISHLG